MKSWKTSRWIWAEGLEWTQILYRPLVGPIWQCHLITRKCLIHWVCQNLTTSPKIFAKQRCKTNCRQFREYYPKKLSGRGKSEKPTCTIWRYKYSNACLRRIAPCSLPWTRPSSSHWRSPASIRRTTDLDEESATQSSERSRLETCWRKLCKVYLAIRWVLMGIWPLARRPRQIRRRPPTRSELSTLSDRHVHP